jgi:23S rRNA (uracil1939-C5)-methyltransferase
VKPPKKNEVLTLTIESVNAKGFGVGRVNEFVLLTDGALPGDRLEVRVVKIKTRYGYAKMQRIIKPSPHRIKSPCPVSDHCGGCQFQHCDYTAQLMYKKQIVIDALTRIGGLENPPVADVIGMEAGGTRYRNKAVFPVVPSRNADGFAIGMYASRSHRLIEVDNCLIQHPAHVRVLSVIKEYIRRNKITPYDEIQHKGKMRQIIVRTSLATGEVMVGLVVNGENLPKETALAETLTLEAGATTVLFNSHTARGNAVLGERFRILSGCGYITESIGEVRYRISAPSFYQINPVQVKTLYDTALKQLVPESDTNHKKLNILDAHAGAGGIALYAAHYLAQKGFDAQIIGVDISAPAISDAVHNAERNGITNAQFIAGSAEEIIPYLLSQNKFTPGTVFLDPPRRGCEPLLLDALIAAEIPQIIYISCDPATLARDIKYLTTGGYGLNATTPVDMFPHTGHIEVIALLCRTGTQGNKIIPSLAL